MAKPKINFEFLIKGWGFPSVLAGIGLIIYLTGDKERGLNVIYSAGILYIVSLLVRALMKKD